MGNRVQLLRMEVKNSVFSVRLYFEYDEFDTLEIVFKIQNQVVFSDLLSVRSGKSEQSLEFPIDNKHLNQKLKIFYSMGKGLILLGSKYIPPESTQDKSKLYSLKLSFQEIDNIKKLFRLDIESAISNIFE